MGNKVIWKYPDCNIQIQNTFNIFIPVEFKRLFSGSQELLMMRFNGKVKISFFMHKEDHNHSSINHNQNMHNANMKVY